MRQQIRFDDFFAHIYTNAFAFILRDCQQHDIQNFCQRMDAVLNEVNRHLTHVIPVKTRKAGIQIEPPFDTKTLIHHVLDHINMDYSSSHFEKNSPELNTDMIALERRKTDHTL